MTMNTIVETYSKLADQYDEDGNRCSCWGISADRALDQVQLKPSYRVVVDVGCGTGRALAKLAGQHESDILFIGVEPASNMRARAVEATQKHGNVEILEGSFEQLPLESSSVDYLFSIHALHWVTDLEQSVKELSRVLKPSGEMDLFFIGRNNGHEFIRKTTPIFLKYMGPTLLLESASMRKQVTRETAARLFETRFGEERLVVDESYTTYYDSLEGHWSWWVRIEGHFVQIPAEKKARCDQEIKQALSELTTDKGIPYTIHLLHVKVKPE
jgi:ubiquinone/menaquinone biosynthesis C-methylase UbiE